MIPRSRHRNDENTRVAERVRARTHTERRSWLWRRALMIVGIAIAMLFASLGNREQQASRASSNLASAIAAAMEAQYRSTGEAPIELPELEERRHGYRDFFFFNLFYAEDARQQGVAGVCAPREPLRLLLREDGRHVVIFRDDHFRAQWMPETEFRKQAAGLGFGNLLSH